MKKKKTISPKPHSIVASVKPDAKSAKIKKLEEELKIEAALEKVRARGMSMKTSDELGLLIGTLFKELTKLDLALTRCVIWIIDPKTNDAVWWMANSEDPSHPMNYVIPYHKAPPWVAFMKEWKKRTKKWVYDLKGKTKKDWDDHLFSKTGLSKMPKFIQKGMRAPARVLLSASFNNFGGMNVASLEPLSDEHFNILLRFAKVFDQTYTRFLDLQKAEAQAREAQIEAALERVRSRSMAMHSSSELSETSAVLFHELKGLRIETTRTGVCILHHENNIAELWLTTVNNERTELKVLGKLPASAHPVFEAWFDAWRKKKPYFHVDLAGKELQRYYESITRFLSLPIQQVSHVRESGYGFFFPDGALNVIALQPLTEEECTIILRFAKVFGQMYRRFLDLQKAEAQAREAQIEAAMEKIRSRSLAMHQSTEMKEVITVFFEKLNELNVLRGTIGIQLFDPATMNSFVWVGNAIQDPQMVSLPYDEQLMREDNLFNDIWRSRHDGTDIINKLYSREQKDKFFDHIFRNNDFTQVPESARSVLRQLPNHIACLIIEKNSALLADSFTGEFFSDEQVKILKRAAKVFEQAYTRFLDLQKAEAQAREARIEMALERIRARALAMHSSNELVDVAKVMREQMALLGQPELESTVVHLYEEEPDHIHSWRAFRVATDTKSEIVHGHMSIPKNCNKFVQEWLDNFYSDLNEYTIELSGTKREEWYKILGKLAPDVVMAMEKDHSIHEKRYYQFSKFSGGALLMISKQQPAEESKYLLRRAAVVFDLAYRRFGDLRKAEAQAREAQIEAALERVRSRSIAMRKSEEIADIVGKIFSELRQLNLVLNRVLIWTFNDIEKYITWWSANPEVESTAESYRVDYNDQSVFINFLKAWQERKPVYLQTLSGDAKRTWEEHLFENTEMSKLPMVVRRSMREEGTIFTTSVISDYGLMMVGSFEPLSDENIDITQRFGRVFQQSYTRYLDVQKAEAQAREAQIEAALERIRSRSLAMHKSDELQEVVNAVFERLKDLNVKMDSANIAIFKEGTRDYDYWIASPDQKRSAVFHVPYLDLFITKDMMNARESGVEFYSNSYSFEEKNKWFDHAYKYSDFKYLTEDRKKFIADAEGITFAIAFANNTGVQFNKFSIDPIPEGDIEILKRFAKVFEQAYIRFLDLQRAEAQAREAKIETALEKVRSRTMAMQHSNELPEAANLLFLEVQSLGIPAWSCGYNILTEDKKSTICIMSSEGTLQQPFKLSLTGESSFNEWYDFLQTSETFFVQELGGKAIQEHYDFMKSFPELNDIFQHIQDAGLSLPTYQINHLVKYTYGFLLFITYEQVPEAHDILKRFTKVFEQTYTRFLDLQKAEASTKEAIKQAALDRIRADIASMRTINDLDRITPLIWKELTILGIPFIRCGVFIMDEEQQLVHTFLSTPEGKAIAAFHLPYDTPGNLSKAINSWHHKEKYIDHWGAEEFTQFADILAKQGALESAENYLKTIPQGGFYLHFLPFLQGMLYVGNTTQLNEEDLNLLQSVADAFATAYARYEDFNKLEAAKAQVDKTLVELKQAQQQLVQSEKMASLGEMTAGIAHEIQNPLNFVNNFSDVSTELLEEMKAELEKGNAKDAKVIADDVIQNLEKILQHGKRADGIVKSMLQHSRVSSGKKEPTDINSLADEYLRLSFHGLRAKDKSFNAKFETDLDLSIGKINLVAQDIGRVILNLINNAFYAVTERKKKNETGYEPTVMVSTKNFGDKIEVRVKDNGNGIPESIKEKIFQPFFTTKPTGSGTGLGLSLSYDLVKAHGGELKSETKEGKGSEFIIQLRTN